ncbi:hypothetical protein [Vibrio parahaemolyticus]|uniref:hypothetical protein n=1 Tax=Vibrio parahaemolyticus TaxID=670 RepID=UPI0035BEF961|nr:hypothetical protein [Vibrio parahaemolyticus]
MNIDAYSNFIEVSTQKLKSVFRRKFNTIPKEKRQVSLTQAYNILAKSAYFSSYQAMISTETALIQISEVGEALINCGASDYNVSEIARLLGADVICPRLTGRLSIGVTDNDSVLYVPYRHDEHPYLSDVEFYPLSVDENTGAWISNADWSNFIVSLREKITKGEELEDAIESCWSEVSIEGCDEVYIENQFDIDEIRTCSEGRFRQIVLENTIYSHADIVYQHLNQERENI